MEEGTEANAGRCTNNYPRTTGILMIKKFKKQHFLKKQRRKGVVCTTRICTTFIYLHICHLCTIYTYFDFCPPTFYLSDPSLFSSLFFLNRVLLYLYSCTNKKYFLIISMSIVFVHWYQHWLVHF